MLDFIVVLIDGKELAKLMVENNLGCSIKQVYEVKQLDTDYFNEEYNKNKSNLNETEGFESTTTSKLYEIKRNLITKVRHLKIQPFKVYLCPQKINQ